MRASKSTDLAMMMATYGLRFLVVVFTIAAAATFLHVNNYRPSKSAFHATFSSLDRDNYFSIFIFWIRTKIYRLISFSLSFSLSLFLANSTQVRFLFLFFCFVEQIFLSCDRPCHHLDWPMICRVKLTLEVFQSLSK